MSEIIALSADQLRWRFAESELDFETTEALDPGSDIVGQPIALEALKFGVECDAPGQNIYVRGVSGTGRMTVVHTLLEQLKPKARYQYDRCYVHNFGQPDRPRLLTLPAGQGKLLRSKMNKLADFLDNRLQQALNGGPIKARREAIRERTQREIKTITQALEKELADNGMTLVQMQTGPATQTAIFPVVDGEPVPPEQFKMMAQAGKVDAEAYATFEQNFEKFSKQFQEISEQASATYEAGVKDLQEYNEGEARRILNNLVADTRDIFRQDSVKAFLDEVIEDVLEYRLGTDPKELPDANIIYGVNVVICHSKTAEQSPVVVEHSPTVGNLIGGVEPELVADGRAITNYRGVHVGSLVKADGGYLILDVRDVLSEPGAWRFLMRALRTGTVEIAPAELRWPMSGPSIQPEPINISVRVILIGSSRLYYQLDAADQDFSDLFKVLADFDTEIPRNKVSVEQYAGVVAKICDTEKLPHFHRSGVAALAEHGARIAARKNKITARFGRVADIVREAAFLARQEGQTTVNRQHVEETVRRTKYRASLPSLRFQELIATDTIHVDTSGEKVGQINGLAVINAGPLSYGFPARITATIGAGQAGIIDIEGRASMSGSIHTKGFQILGGLLRHLLNTDHPLAFSASIGFEQSYGGIDGDSASGAEMCCLLSALTGVPLKQSYAITGAIDQHGRLQAIGGVNEKIEGFYDCCAAAGLNGEHGVIIPLSNAGDLMLREDVVESCRDGKFSIFAVAAIKDALEIFTGMPAGNPDEQGDYPEGTLLDLARDKATEYWRKAYTNPAALAAEQNDKPT